VAVWFASLESRHHRWQNRAVRRPRVVL